MPIHNVSLSTLPSVRQLRALVAVYRTGSVSAAALELAVTQPAVTVLLRELEDRLGVKLFDRTTRRLRKTAAATKAVGYAERALGELSGMVDAMRQLTNLHEGRIRVAATAAVAQGILPPAMRLFAQRNPNLVVEVVEVPPSEFVESVLLEHVDFGVGILDETVTGIMVTTLKTEPLVAAGLSLGSSGGATITWKQLSTLPTIIVKSGYGVRARIDDAVKRAGVKLQIVQEVAHLRTAVAMAANGLGVVVAPPSMVLHEPLFVVRRLVQPTVQRVIGLVAKEGYLLSPAATAFAQLLAQNFRDSSRSKDRLQSSGAARAGQTRAD